MEFRGGRQPVSAAEKYGILGRLAPELDLNTWIDGDGDATAPIRLGDYRGSVVYLYFFQDWWPGYRKSGFPTLKKITQAYTENDPVKFIAVQTVFEGYRSNTPDKLRENQVKYALKIPMAHAAGDPDTRQAPQIMKDYRSGGTPWAVVIDPTGRVAYNGFHIQADEAKALIDRLVGNLD